ncbi:MAG: hypothetical protein Q8O88_05430 [bacterium]|nr:hypothetical protein [bacterium]
MLESSQDLFYIILSLAILWFTVFLCWLLYQAARVLRNANNIIETVTEKLELITDSVHYMKEKMEKMTGIVGILNTMVGGMAEKFLDDKLFSKKIEDRVARRKKIMKKKKNH